MSSEQGSGKPDKTRACAVCRYQRKRCLNCPLAPFFPSNQEEKFQNVHRLYGVHNVMKILKLLQPKDQPAAVETIKFEADMRRNNPVFGCCGIINELKEHIESCKKELDTVNRQLSYYGQRDQQSKLRLQPQIMPMPPMPSMLVPPSRAFHYHSSELAQSAAGINNTEQMETDWSHLYEELDKLDHFDQNQTTQTTGVPKRAEASSSKSAIREKQSVCRRRI